MMNSTRLLRSSISSVRTLPPRGPRLVATLTTAAPYDGPPLPPIKSPSSPQQLVNPYLGGLQKGPAEASTFQLHVYSSRNNTIATFTNQKGNPIAWWTGGSCGFKKSNRSSYEAGYQCTVRAFEKILNHRNEVGPFSLEVVFKGFGQGREAMQKALLASEGEKIRPFVARLTDKTPVKIGGTRAKKARRL
ncbi:translational machinery component [Thelephora terrestris]|uniref:Translational machinery component n=1 Tax=Thelephora terrestris TaxID=56493 RepID=A0A9P6H5S3_9AGAM|nr:translational machinery component [Thelephora terrestris]